MALDILCIHAAHVETVRATSLLLYRLSGGNTLFINEVVEQKALGVLGYVMKKYKGDTSVYMSVRLISKFSFKQFTMVTNI